MADKSVKWRHRLFHTYFLLRRPMTLGARGVILDEAARSVFLIRHTYVPGWQFPGGGVETGHTIEHTLAKELMEEGNIELTARPQLFAIYHNAHASKRDHVALYVCRTAKSPRPDFSNSMPCRKAPPPRRGGGWPKFSTAPRYRSPGEFRTGRGHGARQNPAAAPWG